MSLDVCGLRFAMPARLLAPHPSELPLPAPPLGTSAAEVATRCADSDASSVRVAVDASSGGSGEDSRSTGSRTDGARGGGTPDSCDEGRTPVTTW